MWKLLALAFLLYSCDCQEVYISRCCNWDKGRYSYEEGNVHCMQSFKNFITPITYMDRQIRYVIPPTWRIRDVQKPECSIAHPLDFVSFDSNHTYTLFDTGFLYLREPYKMTLSPQYFCFANHGFMFCNINAKPLKKCCGENSVLKVPNCVNNNLQESSVKDDLNNLLNLDDNFLADNQIDVLTHHYPVCRNEDLTYNQASSYEIKPNADIVLNGEHVIPAGEFCVERDRTYNKDQVTVITCSRHAYSYGEVVKSNIYVLILCAYLINLMRRLY